MAVSLMQSCVLICLLSMVTCNFDPPNSDEVTNLPGLSWKLGFKHYSGYLKATGTRKLHYWYIESTNSPDTDPVVLWMNGGPGCSSMDGLLSEHGPFLAADDGVSLKENPHSWNKVANMLYLEAPAGVGYSYADDKNYTTGDDQVALDNHMALKDFLNKYPKLKTHDFYVSGESYGGIYVPTLSVRLSQDLSFNFRGFIIGNGYFHNSMNENSLIYFAYYHGLYSDALWEEILTNCCNGSRADKCDFIGSQKSSCQEPLSKVHHIVGEMNIYNLYAECHTAGSANLYAENVHVITPVDFLLPHSSRVPLKLLASKQVKVKEVPPCINVTAPTTYLNQQNVRSAIHIPSDLPAWEICSGEVGIMYKREYNSMQEQFLKLLSSGKYRLVVYNGDADMACNFLGDQWFVDSLKQKVAADWQPWYYTSTVDKSKQVAGFIKKYKNISFLTIKGAGHMVPSDKPIPALNMFTDFINGNI